MFVKYVKAKYDSTELVDVNSEEQFWAPASLGMGLETQTVDTWH